MKELLLRRKRALIRYIIGSLFPTMIQFLIAGVFVLIFDSMQKRDLVYFKWIVVMTIAVALITMGLSLASRLMRIGFMRDTLLDIRKQAFDKIVHMSYREFSKASKEVYISHLVNDINTFENNFFVNLLNVISLGATYLVSFIVLLVLDVKLALAMFVVSLVLFGISKLFANKTNDLQEDVSKKNEKFTVDMANTFNGLEILKLNNIETKFLEKSFRAINRVEHKKLQFNIYSELQRSIIMFSGYGVLMAVLVYMVFNMPMNHSIAKMLFSFQMCNNMIFPLIEILPRFNVMKSSIKIYDKITHQEDATNLLVERENEFVLGEAISVENLSFSYEEQNVLNNANFVIEKGKKYLIKGVSGTGKSTLIKLLSMIYDTYEGNIRVDGINYRDIKERSFNDQVAFIYQDVFLFEDSIRNNITLYKDLSETQIQEAVRLAGLEEFIKEQPQGLDTLLMENGKNLSGGQRQRIAIARAIAKNAQILFVDEGTSALNEAIGRQIEATFLNLDATVIAISHRYYPGVTEQYDGILEIKNGSISSYDTNAYFEEVAVC